MLSQRLQKRLICIKQSLYSDKNQIPKNELKDLLSTNKDLMFLVVNMMKFVISVIALI